MKRTFQLLFCADAALFGAHHATVDAFSAITITTTSRRHQQRRKFRSNNIPILFSSSSLPGSTYDTPQTADSSSSSSMKSIEAAGVKRFTIGYDKLCKSCPTRLTPRVDTLTEMILGLPDEERDELMHNVAKRLQEAQNHQEGEAKVVSPRDVYEFQTSGVAEKPPKKQKMKKEKSSANNRQREEADNSKLSRKMDKARMKFACNKQHAARARRLLAVTNALLSRHSHEKETTMIGTGDNGWYHEIDWLKQLSRAELKMERLKLTAQKAKHEQKIAKQRMKLYGASMALTYADKKEDRVADNTKMENPDLLLH